MSSEQAYEEKTTECPEKLVSMCVLDLGSMAEDQRQDVRGLRSQRGEETPPIHVQGIPDTRRLRIANQEGRSESSMDRFMTQWIQMDQARTERETQRWEEDQQRMMEQQERMFQLLATAPRPVVAKPPLPAPRLTLQKFNEGVDNMGAYLEMFEAAVRAAHWPNDQWAMFLQSALSGGGLTAVAAMPVSWPHSSGGHASRPASQQWRPCQQINSWTILQ